MPVEAKFTLQIFTEVKTVEWDRILISLTHPHLLQSSHWAELKRPNGWQPIYVLWTDEIKIRLQPRSCIRKYSPGSWADAFFTLRVDQFWIGEINLYEAKYSQTCRQWQASRKPCSSRLTRKLRWRGAKIHWKA